MKKNKKVVRKSEAYKTAEAVVMESEQLDAGIGTACQGGTPYAGGADGTGIDRGRDPEDAGDGRHRGCKGEIPLSAGQ